MDGKLGGMVVEASREKVVWKGPPCDAPHGHMKSALVITQGFTSPKFNIAPEKLPSQ